ncbi:MAG: hypothetical protein IT487_11185 [Chromatiaceae bacterium]|nr:hypothetical protein [Chromatiaceae bacterium]
MKPSIISANICRPTFRGLSDETPPEYSWFPVWLLARHFQFRWDAKPDFLFYGDIGNGEHLCYPSRTRRIFVTGENIAPDWREADYALTHERIWDDRHWRAPLWRHYYDPGHTQVQRDFSVVCQRVDRFCNFIYSNDRARHRIEFFQLLNHRKTVDSGGKVMNNLGGRIDDKSAYLARCKFTIAFENESHPGYATEKIIEPLLQGSIPIYWGDPYIEEDFNPDCFINVQRFPDFEAVIEEVLRIDADEALWEKYVSAPIFRDDRLPDRLTDAAYCCFFRGVTENSSPPISPLKKRIQRFNRKTQHGTDKLQFILQKIQAEVRRRLSAIMKHRNT